MKDEKNYYKKQFISSIEYYDSVEDCIIRDSCYTNDFDKAIKFLHTQISLIQVLRDEKNPYEVLETSLYDRSTLHKRLFTEKQILNENNSNKISS